MPTEMYEWINIKDKLPDIGHQVVLITTERFWNTPKGIPDANVTATGYLSKCGDTLYWSIFGERGMDINAFTHWMPLQNPSRDDATK